MLEINHLDVYYGDHQVINQLSLQWEAGQVHGLIGLNGSGKTTLFKALYHMVPYKGDILWKGSPLAKQDLSWLETHNYFYHYITGREYLSLLEHAAGNHIDIERWAGLLSIPLDELVDGYSTGMKKKLALLGVLMQKRPVILLDEPFNGVDMESSRLLELLFRGLKDKGYTLVITSHILDTLMNSCDSASLLENGKISQYFSKDELIDMESSVFHKLDQQLKPVLDECLGQLNALL